MYHRAVWNSRALIPASLFFIGAGPSAFYNTNNNNRTRTEEAPDPSSSVDKKRLAYWQNRWTAGKTQWHKTVVNPSLQKFIDSHLLKNNDGNDKPVRVLVPLCGKSVDMSYLAEHAGVSLVMGVEGVHRAIVEFTKEHPDLDITPQDDQSTYDGPFVVWLGGSPPSGNNSAPIVVLEGDFFSLNPKSAGGRFAAVWDRAALVAVDPSVRSKYVEVLGSVIEPGGTILLSTYIRLNGDTKTGPPFSIDEDEVHRLFGSLPWVESIECVDTVASFAGEPWYKAVFGFFRLGRVCNKIFVIKAKK